MLSLTELTKQLDKYSVAMADDGRIRSATFFEHLQFLLSPTYKTHQITKVLETLANALHAEKRLTPFEVFSSRELYILRMWLARFRKCRRNAHYETALKEFKKELTAYRLGITSANLDASSGLEAFTNSRAYLYNHLAFYEHILLPESLSENAPIKILMGGRYVSWEDAKAAVVDQPDVQGLWPLKYDQFGLTNKDYGEWRNPHARTYYARKHPAPGKFLFTYCLFCSKIAPRFSGDHAWFKLTTPEGLVYEFGKYRPPYISHVSSALINYPAKIQSPDLSSAWPVAPKEGLPLNYTDNTQIVEIPFEITQKDFEKALDKITSIQEHANNTFGLFDNSCLVLANDIAKECNIEIDTSTSMVKLVCSKFHLPDRYIKWYNKWQEKVPPVIINIVFFIPGVLSNLILCAFFGARSRYAEGGPRHIDSLWDILNPNKSILHHPWYLANIVKDEIEKNRPEGKPFGIPKKFDLNERSH